MTDNEIINALECCSETKTSDCKECPLLSVECSEYDLYKLALDLINRQKAEIERLENSLSTFKSCYESLTDMYETAKSEAINEFWNCRPERLNEHFEGKEEYNKGWNACLHEFYETKKDLVKEMAGE